MTITIEPEPSRSSRCDCCGGVTTNLTRFVYLDGNAYAVYYAAFSDNHIDGIVSVLIGLGEWGEDASPENRTAFAARIRVIEGEFQVMLIDGKASPWKDVTFLGEHLSRDEALAHPLVKDVFRLTDVIVHEDADIHAYFERTGGYGAQASVTIH